MQQKKSYHNTNKETGKVLKQSQDKALTQEQIIYKIFKKYPKKDFTPFEIMNYLFSKSIMSKTTPITSIRRAISNLETSRFIYNNGNKRIGGYGKINYCWKYLR